MKKIFPDNACFTYTGGIGLTISSREAVFSRRLIDSPHAVDCPGSRVRFRSDASVIRARFAYAPLADLPDHNVFNSTGVCLVDGTPRCRFTRAGDAGGEQTITLPAPGDGTVHQYDLVLPFADQVCFRGLSVNDGAAFYPLPRCLRKRYVAYGDSITQGFRAADPTHTYPYLLANARGWELINLGFGSRRATAADGEAIAAQMPDRVTVLIGVNDCLGGVPLAVFRAQFEGLIANIRKISPPIPILAITPLTVVGNWEGAERLEEYRAAIRAAVAERHDTLLHLAEGPALIPPEPDYFQDGLHPNDTGFILMTRSLESALRRVGW